MICPSVRKNRLALERNVTGTNPYAWVSVVGDLPVTIPPTATWNPAVGVFLLIGHCGGITHPSGMFGDRPG